MLGVLYKTYKTRDNFLIKCLRRGTASCLKQHVKYGFLVANCVSFFNLSAPLDLPWQYLNGCDLFKATALNSDLLQDL